MMCRSLAAAALAALLLTACGGGSNPLDNPSTVQNPPLAAGGRLSFTYFQKCVNPVLLAQLQVQIGSVTSTNSCAGAGCHNSVSGTGGALRVVPTTQTVDLADPANTPEVIRATDMYRNFFSSQGVTNPGTPGSSRLLTKPLVQGVLHGGGLIFDNADDPNAKILAYWINRPTPSGQDEFAASNQMFTPPDPVNGSCNTQ